MTPHLIDYTIYTQYILELRDARKTVYEARKEVTRLQEEVRELKVQLAELENKILSNPKIAFEILEPTKLFEKVK